MSIESHIMGACWCYIVTIFLLSIGLVRGNTPNVAESMFGGHTAIEYCDEVNEECTSKVCTRFCYSVLFTQASDRLRLHMFGDLIL